MNNTKAKSNKICESIAVIAIYLPNVVEIPFEENSEFLLEQYRDILLLCADIVRQENNYRDMVIHNTCIYAVFDKALHTEKECVIAAARQIQDLFGKVNHKMERALEQLYFGIGVAAGVAVRVPIEDPDMKTMNSVWLGKVLDDARSLAQMAFCDGRDRIRIADTVFCDVYP